MNERKPPKPGFYIACLAMVIGGFLLLLAGSAKANTDEHVLIIPVEVEGTLRPEQNPCIPGKPVPSCTAETVSFAGVAPGVVRQHQGRRFRTHRHFRLHHVTVNNRPAARTLLSRCAAVFARGRVMVRLSFCGQRVRVVAANGWPKPVRVTALVQHWR